MQTLDCVSGLYDCLEFSEYPSCLDEAICKHGKVLYCLNIALRELRLSSIHRRYSRIPFSHTFGKFPLQACLIEGIGHSQNVHVGDKLS